MREFDIEFEVTQKFKYWIPVKAETPEEAIRILQSGELDAHDAEEDYMIESQDNTEEARCLGERITEGDGNSHRIQLKDAPKYGSHIVKAETDQTGGHVMVDHLTLTDGYRIGITEESVCSLVKLKDENYDERDQLGSVDICLYGNDDVIDYDGGSLTFIDELTVLSDDGIVQYDVVIMKNGIVITIDDAQITVFENYTYMKDSSKAIGIIKRA